MKTDTSVHRRTWDQIPWILNGTLPEAELRLAAQHLQSCSDCREELEFQRHVAQSLSAGEPADMDPQGSWERLRARIEADSEAGSEALLAAPLNVLSPAQQPAHQPTHQPTHQRWMGWLVAAMVVQAVGLGLLGNALWSRQAGPAVATPAVYRTLSAAAESAVAVAPTIRVVFAADLNVGQMQTLLNRSGLQVLSGPSSAGVWSLGPGDDSNHTATQAALQQLRGNPAVHFAEAVGGSP
jgi:hypothetical protein